MVGKPFIFAGLVLLAYSVSRVTGGAINGHVTSGNMALSNGQNNIKQSSLTHVPQRCLLSSDKGTCRDNQVRYYFDSSNGNCAPFHYSGCGGNWNRFQSQAECTSVCSCALTPEPGPCRAHMWRWFYSQADGCCRPFVYGGCGGNSNNYVTWTECSKHCGYPKAGSNWWKWGAEWGTGQGKQIMGSHGGSQGTAGGGHGRMGNQQKQYGQNDFMRDWFLSSLLMGGEGMEMEELAAMIGAGHMFGQSGGAGASQAGQGSGSVGGGFNTWLQTRPGSFTPLGHVGSADNLINVSASGDTWTHINGGRWGQMSGMGASASQYGQAGSQYGQAGSQYGQSASQFGQQSASQFGQSASQFGHGFRPWITDRNGAGYGLEGTAFDVFRIIAELSSGELSQLDLKLVAKTFGALDRRGRVNFDLLAQRLVGSLMSNSGRNNMAALRGVAELLGTVDLEGNINANMFLIALANAVRRGAQVKAGGNMNTNTGTGASGNTNQNQGTTGSTGLGTGTTRPTSGTPTGAPSTAGIIRQLQAGYLTSKDLGRLANMFGAAGPNGAMNMHVLTQNMMKALTSPGSGVSLAELRDLARSFNAFDLNGNINIDIFHKGLLAALSQLIPNGAQSVAKTSAVEMHNIFRRIHSGTMRHNDLVGLAIRYGARQQNGNIDIRLLANRMVSSLQTPTNSRDASLLRFVAQSLGALNRGGNINVQLFINGMVNALQSVVPGSPNSGLIIGRGGVPGSGGSTAMEMIKVMGNMATGNFNPNDLHHLARRFGALSSTGNVNINKLAKTMVNALVGEAKTSNLADLKRVAMSFGALDGTGKINLDQFMKGLMGMFQTGGSGSWSFKSGSKGGSFSSGSKGGSFSSGSKGGSFSSGSGRSFSSGSKGGSFSSGSKGGSFSSGSGRSFSSGSKGGSRVTG